MCMSSKTLCKRTLSKRPKLGFQDQLSLNAGQKYYRMLQEKHSAILLTFIRLPCVVSLRYLFCLFFQWPFYIGFTIYMYVLLAHIFFDRNY